MKLVIATHNQGKLAEFKALLAPLGVDAVSAGELNLAEPDETGLSFIDNASLKSIAAAKASGLMSLADDSGLVVPALDGAPGIYSARWAGPDKDFSVAFERIQRELGERDAAAHFVCVLALSNPDGSTLIFSGEVHGKLCFPPRGLKGFGYDPIFIPDGSTQTFAEMEPAEKNAMSHRTKAFSAFAQYWNQSTHA